MRFILLLFMSLLFAAPAAIAAPVAAVTDALVIGPQDQIEVNVDNYPNLKTVTRIATDGSIVLPLVGMVKVGGLSPADAANEIETHYVNGGYIKLPSVRIEVLDYQSRKASVLGQVVAQGLFTLDRSYTVAEIIARAGGLAPDAGNSAVVVRQSRGGATERINIDLEQLMRGAAGTDAMQVVRAGDVIFVPRAETFSVIGAVNRAGVYRISGIKTVQQALATAGDLSPIGTTSGLKVRRMLTGSTALATYTIGIDDPVLPGDVLIVRSRFF